MRYLTTSICLALSVLFTGFASADDEAPSNEGQGDRRAEMRRRIMDEFDADGDGELSDEERAKAREEMRSRRGNRGGQGQADGPRGNRQRGERMRGPEGRRGGPGGLPDPAELFERFDADGSGSLSREEFKKLSEEMRPPRGPRGPRGPEAGPDGPESNEGPRRRFDRQRPLQNPDGADGPPRRRGEGRRRMNDEDGPQARGPRGNGPGARDPGGPGGGPNPDAIFDRLDEDGDGQLSRAEFMKLADRMRQMRERGGPGGPGGQRMREGRGPGRGGPDGEEGQQRRRRRARPEFDDEAKAVAPNADNSV